MDAMSRTLRRIVVGVVIGATILLAGKFYVGLKNVLYDKSMNANVFQRARQLPDIPLGVVVPAGNRWVANAFVAERSTDGIAVLILDDHYRGDDAMYRSGSGVIGDDISKPLLCALPADAALKAIVIDPVVSSLIEANCGGVGGGLSSAVR